jgi:molybdopterin-guanine dinucleotide biosynthesis protein A
VETLDAVVLAAGRLSTSEAARAGHEIKALVRIGETTPLRAMLAALRRTPQIQRVVIVGPQAVSESARSHDQWIAEGVSVHDNALAGLRAVSTRRVLLCSSDVPFVEAEHVKDFLARVPPDADIAYPIFGRDEFLAAFPEGRTKFARVGENLWTGGSVCVLTTRVGLANEKLMRQAFAARRSQLAMASFLGAGILTRHLVGTLRVDHVIERIEHLTGGKTVAVRGAHPALAMDCDSIVDVEYARLIDQKRTLHAPR